MRLTERQGNQGGTVFRDEDVKEADLPLWLEEKGGFRRPEAVLHKDVKASFRLLYQQWPSERDIADSDCLPMAKNTMTLIMRGLCLPRSYFYDFASKKSITLGARPSFTERTISKSKPFLGVLTLTVHRSELAEPAFETCLHVHGDHVQLS